MSRVLQILRSILDGFSRKEIHHRWTAARHCRVWLSCMQFAGRITLTYHWTGAWHSPLLLDPATCRCTAARYCQGWPPCVLTHHWLAVSHCQIISLSVCSSLVGSLTALWRNIFHSCLILQPAAELSKLLSRLTSLYADMLLTCGKTMSNLTFSVCSLMVRLHWHATGLWCNTIVTWGYILHGIVSDLAPWDELHSQQWFEVLVFGGHA